MLQVDEAHHIRSCNNMPNDSTEGDRPNKLAQLLKQKVYDYQKTRHFDKITYRDTDVVYRDMMQQLGQNVSLGKKSTTSFFRAMDRLLDMKGLYNKARNCGSDISNVQELWVFYRSGGLMCDVYDLDALQTHRKIVNNVVAAEITDTHGVTLVTHLTGDRIITLEKIVQHWNGECTCILV